MTLFETYQTLLRRGCPRHPRLREGVIPTGHGGTLTAVDAGNLWTLNGARIEENDARDLVTMGALRWFLGLKTPGDCIPHGVQFLNAMDRVEVLVFPASKSWMGSSVCSGSDAIAAIIAATEHLEPEKL